jgi:ubiquinone/menaquinone biosynthesis C-methylase UbiE
MEITRTRFQGIYNIIRFNRHLYIPAIGLCVLLFTIAFLADTYYDQYLLLSAIILSLPLCMSLCISYYIYDLSNLYTLRHLDILQPGPVMLNIHAGFDETSSLLRKKYPESHLDVLDFYDPIRHTEISIKRARLAYPPFPGTQSTVTTHLPFQNHHFDLIFVIFSAHEIRSEDERTRFFRELQRILKPSGSIIVTEHLRDLPNFLAYTIGFFHFFSLNTWFHTFKHAGLHINKTIKSTIFVNTFILKKNGITP